MNIYQHKYWWKVVLAIVALLIVGCSLLYNSRLAANLAEEEKKKVQYLAEAYREALKEKETANLNFYITLFKENTTIPLIITDDKGNIQEKKNLNPSRENDSTYLKRQLRLMKESYEPIEIKIRKDKSQFLYYRGSNMLWQLKIYPAIQFAIIAAFLFIGYLAFSTARKAEQNRVWVGMARETAHQLGTPLSSLGAWLEMLADRDEADVRNIGAEMQKDVDRLDLITERFSKIGSTPKLKSLNINEHLLSTFSYVKRRASNKIEFHHNLDEEVHSLPFSPPLLDWVVENLLKNALDAMEESGRIELLLSKEKNQLLIDVSDTGKGIPKSNSKDVFQPGFSTKKRGWGLGLSLSKRIIENYHRGKIFVHKSQPGQGTTFRIILPDADTA